MSGGRVEAAARALADASFVDLGWEGIQEFRREQYRALAEVALRAADSTDPRDVDRVVVEWGRVPDCEAQGCDPPHEDGTVPWPYGEPDLNGPAPEVNRHACKWVRRTVTYSSWRAVLGGGDKTE